MESWLGWYTGCTGGLGRGEYLPHGVGSGAGHGGKGGDAYNDGSYIKGGVTYGNAELPCELGSGSGNESLPSAAAGGGIIGKLKLMISECRYVCVYNSKSRLEKLTLILVRFSGKYTSASQH